jgi:hypothetical protein
MPDRGKHPLPGVEVGLSAAPHDLHARPSSRNAPCWTPTPLLVGVDRELSYRAFKSHAIFHVGSLRPLPSHGPGFGYFSGIFYVLYVLSQDSQSASGYCLPVFAFIFCMRHVRRDRARARELPGFDVISTGKEAPGYCIQSAYASPLEHEACARPHRIWARIGVSRDGRTPASLRGPARPRGALSAYRRACRQVMRRAPISTVALGCRTHLRV